MRYLTQSTVVMDRPLWLVVCRHHPCAYGCSGFAFSARKKKEAGRPCASTATNDARDTAAAATRNVAPMAATTPLKPRGGEGTEHQLVLRHRPWSTSRYAFSTTPHTTGRNVERHGGECNGHSCHRLISTIVRVVSLRLAPDMKRPGLCWPVCPRRSSWVILLSFLVCIAPALLMSFQSRQSSALEQLFASIAVFPPLFWWGETNARANRSKDCVRA